MHSQNRRANWVCTVLCHNGRVTPKSTPPASHLSSQPRHPATGTFISQHPVRKASHPLPFHSLKSSMAKDIACITILSLLLALISPAAGQEGERFTCRTGRKCNVLKPVPQPPLEPELDLNKASGTKLFWGRPCHVDAQHGPKQEAGVQGGGTAPLVGSGAKPQKPAMICTYYNQLYNGNAILALS